jgi:hypothetical protein
MMSLLPLAAVDRYEMHRGEMRISSEPEEWRWCVNPRCSRVMRRSVLTAGEFVARRQLQLSTEFVEVIADFLAFFKLLQLISYQNYLLFIEKMLIFLSHSTIVMLILE